ncbi:hypothetical protein [Brevundimonas sp.]|uniref:hypothetical protein n=1 Tax=Brevundimonas sp. TaxID=1871086 RepID=UPI00391CABC3|nr:hypothetical protein [Brevundimonas sp.]
MSPDEALASIREAKAELGRNADYPIGWDILFGLMIAAMFVALGYSQVSPALVVLGSLGGLFWMVSWWRNRFGWWVNAWVPKKARWVIFLMWPLLFGCIGLSIWTRSFGGPWWAPLVGGALTFVITLSFGRWWMSVYRRELAEEGK